MMSEERRLRSSVWRSERIPIVTLSKSMRSAAFGAWTTAGPLRLEGVMAWGPRWSGAIGARVTATWESRGIMMSLAYSPVAGRAPRLGRADWRGGHGAG